MMNYDFSSLNDKEFELLARDILNAQFGLDLQNFKSGKDGGIDLRFSTPINSNSTIVQAKHYFKSGLAKLVADLVKKELPKVKKIQPDRYIIVTSIELSAVNKDDLVKKFNPYIKTANDILGREDLNKYLATNKDIETRWYKLWLTSVTVLERILHNATHGRSAFMAAKIKKKIGLYVHNQSYHEGLKILSDHKYILITGQPGVGKTTLAHMLTYTLLSKGYQLVHIDGNIKDASDLLTNDPSQKQLFYFDDFLGATYMEIIHPKTSESSLVEFLEQIRSVPNKYLVLTTRTSIFRTALEKYEKMRRIRVDIARKELELGEYSDLDKAKILYSHLYHTGLPEHMIKEVIKGKKYWKIIRHTNYNPRLIEFITEPFNLTHVKEGEFMDFAIHHLDHPEEVWMHAYSEQLTLEEKILLHAIFSQKSNTEAEVTKEIFDAFLQHEMTHYNYRPEPNPFQRSLNKLLDGIIKRELHTYSNKEILQFINPSIKDFLTSYFIKHEEERWKLIEGAIFLEQHEQYLEYFFNVWSKEVQQYISRDSGRYIKFLVVHADSLRTYQTLFKIQMTNDFIRLRIAALLNGFGLLSDENWKMVRTFTLEVIKCYPLKAITFQTKKAYLKCLVDPEEDSSLMEYVKSNWKPVIIALFNACQQVEDFEEVKELFEIYGVDYESFIQDIEMYQVLEKLLDDYVEQSTHDWINGGKKKIYDKHDLEYFKEEVRDNRQNIYRKFLIDDTTYSERYFFDDDAVKEWIENNNVYVPTEGGFDFENFTPRNLENEETSAVDQLFS